MEISKEEMAKSMLFVIKTVLQNAKFGNFSDQVEQEKMSFITHMKMLSDVEINSVYFEPEGLVSQLKADKENHTVWLQSSEDFVRFNISFKYYMESLGVKTNYGSGSALFTSNHFFAYVGVNEIIFSHFEFDFNLSEISIDSAFGVAPLEWLRGKLLQWVYPQLQLAISTNEGFLAKYLFLSEYIVHHNYPKLPLVFFQSFPTGFSPNEHSLDYYFDTSVVIDNKIYASIDLVSESTSGALTKGVKIVHSPAFVPLTFQAFLRYNVLDPFLEFEALGLTGTVRDFFQVLPQLQEHYIGTEPISAPCKFDGSVPEYYTNNNMRLSFYCSFQVKFQPAFLHANISYLLQYQSVSNDLSWESSFSNPKIEKVNFIPRNINIVLFFTHLFHSAAQQKFINKQWEIPRIDFSPILEYSKASAEIINNQFVSIYE